MFTPVRLSLPPETRAGRVWLALLVSFIIGPWGFFWEFGPCQLTRALYIGLWTIAPEPFPGAQIPDRFLCSGAGVPAANNQRPQRQAE